MFGREKEIHNEQIELKSMAETRYINGNFGNEQLLLSWNRKLHRYYKGYYIPHLFPLITYFLFS